MKTSLMFAEMIRLSLTCEHFLDSCCFSAASMALSMAASLEGAIAAGPLGCAQSSLCFFLPFIWIFHHIFTACTASAVYAPNCVGCASSLDRLQ